MRLKLFLPLLAVPALAACSAVTSTTNTAARTLESGLNATTNGTEATSQTGESDTYADARRFVDSQFAMLQREAAAGGGEHTAALARLMGEQDTEAFGNWMQSHYAVLFADLDNHADLVTRIEARRDETTTIGRKNDA